MSPIIDALGGRWDAVGFFAVIVPVALYYAFKVKSPRRPARRPDAPDIDEGLDL
jgi:hypothetical protein